MFEEICELLEFQPITFTANDDKNRLFYHTNVMMWIGTKVAAVCLESIHDKEVINRLFSLILTKIFHIFLRKKQ